MMQDPQSDLLIVAALTVFSQVTSEEILAEHAKVLADQIAEQHGLTIEDSVYNLEYVRPEELSLS